MGVSWGMWRWFLWGGGAGRRGSFTLEVGGLMTGASRAFCVSDEVSGKFSLCNFCLSSVGDMCVCPVIDCVLRSLAFM